MRTIDLTKANVSGYMKDGIGLWLGAVERDHDLNVQTISIDNPKADYVFDFEVVNWAVNVDFILMQSYVRTAKNPIKALSKACRLLNAGGYLLIVDNVNPDAGVKNYFNYGEMEGLLQLLEAFIFIEARGFTGDHKHYYYVCKKKLEAVDNGETLECENETGTEETSEKG